MDGRPDPSVPGLFRRADERQHGAPAADPKFTPADFRLIEARQPPLKDRPSALSGAFAKAAPRRIPLTEDASPTPGDLPHVRIRIGRADRHTARRDADQFRPRAGSVAQHRHFDQGALRPVQLSRRDRLGHAQDDRQSQARAHLRQALGSLFFGVPPSPGATQTQFGEAASVPAISPYTYTPTYQATSSPIRASSMRRARCH